MFKVDGVEAAGSVEISKKMKLPALSAVYFVVKEGKVVYVGKSNNICSRWKTHDRVNDFILIGGASLYWLKTSEKDLGRVESKYIELLTPNFNRKGVAVSYKVDGKDGLHTNKCAFLARDLGVSMKDFFKPVRGAGASVERRKSDSFLLSLQKIEGLSSHWGINPEEFLSGSKSTSEDWLSYSFQRKGYATKSDIDLVKLFASEDLTNSALAAEKEYLMLHKKVKESKYDKNVFEEGIKQILGSFPAHSRTFIIFLLSAISNQTACHRFCDLASVLYFHSAIDVSYTISMIR